MKTLTPLQDKQFHSLVNALKNSDDGLDELTEEKAYESWSTMDDKAKALAIMLEVLPQDIVTEYWSDSPYLEATRYSFGNSEYIISSEPQEQAQTYNGTELFLYRLS